MAEEYQDVCDRKDSLHIKLKLYSHQGKRQTLIRRRKNMDYGLAQAKDIYTYRAKIRFSSMERQSQNTAEEKCDLCKYKDSLLF